MKKNKKSEPQPQVPIPDPNIMQEPLRLSREELLEFRALEAELEIASLKAQLLVLQKKNYLRQIDPLDNLTKYSEEIKATSMAAAQISDTRLALRQKIQTKLGIELDKYAYDDQTGELKSVDL